MRLAPIIATLFLVSAPALAGSCEVLAAAKELRAPGSVFLASFPDAPDGPLKDTAFLYDNAAAAIALVACGDDAAAARIADAMLIAQKHDRYWNDGRLRNAYLAGPVKDLPVKLPGWWEPAQNKWVEDRYQVGSDTGNLAWAMLAFLTVGEATRAPQYRAGAEAIARHVEKSLSHVKPAGFDGGVFGHEPKPERNTWKSTEHNTDLAAAFARLAKASGERHWALRARQAERFVAAMWDDGCGCYFVGTGADGRSRNPMVALDAQVWPLLALPSQRRHQTRVLASVRGRLGVDAGFAYSDVKQGVWSEGVAQMALLLARTGRQTETDSLLAGLPRTSDGWVYASDRGSLPTGFQLQTDPSQPRLYFRTPHLAALAWAALAEQGFNPLSGEAPARPHEHKH